MTHRTEQILVAVHNNLKSLSTTKSRVYRDFVYDLKEYPSLLLEYDNEELIAELSTDLADWILYFGIDIKVKAENYSTTVNKIRSEITVALMTDTTQGLSFIHDTQEIGLLEPEKSFNSEKPTASQRMNWMITYRRNRSTPE